MIGFDFLRPGLAWLLLLAPLALALGWGAYRRSRSELAGWVAERRRARFLPGVSRGRAHLRVVLGAAGILFLALATLGPVRGYTYRAVSRKGLDLVLCLDTSRSMLAQDLRPSRLERAKREVVGLLDVLRDDRVALVAFSGDTRDVAPLTRDRGTLEGLLAYVTPEDNREGGTDLAAALERALQLFDGRTGAHEAIVLLTDGEDLEGKAAAQAEEAVKRNIRVFVVGVGTEAGGKIPVLDEGGRSGFLRDPEGNEVVTKLGRESLAALAARTGGEFLSAEQSPTPLEDLYRARITGIEGREIEGGERRVPYDRFQWPLALGIACLLAEIFLRQRAPRPAAEPAGARLAAGWLPLLALAGGAETFSFPRALADVVARHERADAAAAEEAARTLLAQAEQAGLSEGERARAHFALGVIAATRALASEERAEVEAARETARAALSAARALAGPGALRDDAIFDLGALDLFQAEAVRATIPELGGQPAGGALSVPPPPAGAPGAAPAEPPDPLQEARGLYRAARGWFLERLRLEWSDEDTRANLELIQRRLRELDEIEKKREEQKQEQQQDPDQQSDEQGDEQDPKDQQDPKDEKDQQKDDQEKQQDEQPKDGEDEQEPKPEESEQPKDGEQPPPEPGEEQQPEPAPSEPEPGQEEGQPAPSEPKETAERVLTREEVMQLLDKLGQLEKQQKALEGALRARQQKKTRRDW